MVGADTVVRIKNGEIESPILASRAAHIISEDAATWVLTKYYKKRPRRISKSFYTLLN